MGFDNETNKKYVRLHYIDAGSYTEFTVKFLMGLADKYNISFEDCLSSACKKLGCELISYQSQNLAEHINASFTIEEQYE